LKEGKPTLSGGKGMTLEGNANPKKIIVPPKKMKIGTFRCKDLDILKMMIPNINARKVHCTNFDDDNWLYKYLIKHLFWSQNGQPYF